MKSFRLAIVAAVAACLLAGCAATPQPTLYELQPEIPAVSASAAAHPPKTGVLRVDMPQIAADLDNDRIQLRQTDGTVDFIANAAWNEAPNRMLEPLLVASLDAAGIYSAVVNSRAAVGSDFALQTTLEEFTLVDVPADAAMYKDANAHVEITLRLDLTRIPTDKLLASKRITVTAPVDAIRMGAIIPAFNQATTDLLNQVTQAVTPVKHASRKN